jgi:hypothetical protein
LRLKGDTYLKISSKGWSDEAIDHHSGRIKKMQAARYPTWTQRHQVVLLFKDSKSGTAEPKGTSNHFHKARKITAIMLIAPKDFPSTISVPPLARPLSPTSAIPSVI